MQYSFDLGYGGNVFYLNAPYALLVEAFGNDGQQEPRDKYKYKCMCQWSADRGSDAFWEVYDYKVGTCYDQRDGLAREAITEWHVQYGETGRQILTEKLDAAVRRLSGVPPLPVGESEYLEIVDDTAQIAEQIKDQLSAGHSVNIGERDWDGFFVLGGISITMSHGVRVAVGLGEDRMEEASAPMSEIEAREAYRALGVYLDLLDERKN